MLCVPLLAILLKQVRELYQGRSSSTKGGRATAMRDKGRACAEVYTAAAATPDPDSRTGTLAGLIA